MEAKSFVYWLQGYFEITGSNILDVGQVEIIKNHLNLVFKHEIDPSLNEGKTKEEVKELQDVHDGKEKKLSDLIKDGPPLKKNQDVVDWLSSKSKPPHKSNGGWNSNSYDDTLLRC